MPTTQPGPSRNVQSWIATSDRPVLTSEAPPAAPTSCRNVTTAMQAEDADADEHAFHDTGGDVAEGEALVLPLEDREQHDGGADVGDDDDHLEERSEGDAAVGAGADDVVGMIQHRV